MNQPFLDKVIDDHRKTLLAAGDNPIAIIAANKAFFAKKLGYLPLTAPLSESYLFNRNTRSSYHPWSASVVGEAFGDSGLKELISIRDYLYTPPLIDEFLEGVIVGIRKATERKARHLKEQQRKANGNSLPPDIAKMMTDKGQ